MTNLRVAMLYAAPLVWHDEQGKPHPIDSLDFDTERTAIFDSLREAGREIEVRVAAATDDNLRTLITLGCRVLHYSGHGHPEFLAFEDGQGGTHHLDPTTLQELIAAGGGSPAQLAFVSACHSRKAGEAFVEAGIPHVVAVRLETPVYDTAAERFARAFYLALAVGKRVQEAFDIARSAVSSMKGPTASDAEKFILLPEYGKHDVAIFADAPTGGWTDATIAEPPTNLPAVPEHFLGRNIDMQKIVAMVRQGRLTTIRGAPGIGKTALATTIGHYVNERRLFHDGVFFISLRGVQSAEAVRAAVALALGVQAKTDEELLATLKARQSLLILDNCEDPLHSAAGEFRQFVQKVLEQAGESSLLITSRQALGGALPGHAERVHHLSRLEPLDAAGLFIRLAPRPLTNAEVGTGDLSEAIEKLARHPALTFLSGHPHAIALAAPLLQDKSLDQVHNLLASKDVDALVVEGIPEDERDAVTSLVVSLSVSVDYIRERDPQAVRLFAMMGLLPAGTLPLDLDELWAKDGVPSWTR